MSNYSFVLDNENLRHNIGTALGDFLAYDSELGFSLFFFEILIVISIIKNKNSKKSNIKNSLS